MPDAHRTSVEFDALLDESGRIVVPESLVGDLKKNPGSLHVRVTTKAISSDMQRRGINEDEIGRISSIQLEPREQVIKFLLSEGALDKKSSQRRIR